MSTRAKIAIGVSAGIIIIIGILFYLYGPFGQASSEKTSNIRLSLFAYPYEVKVGGKNSSKIMAVVKRKQEPVANANVFFTTNLGELSESQKMTDSSGQAVVYLTSKVPGEARVVALVNDKSKNVKVLMVSD